MAISFSVSYFVLFALKSGKNVKKILYFQEIALNGALKCISFPMSLHLLAYSYRPHDSNSRSLQSYFNSHFLHSLKLFASGATLTLKTHTLIHNYGQKKIITSLLSDTTGLCSYGWLFSFGCKHCTSGAVWCGIAAALEHSCIRNIMKYLFFEMGNERIYFLFIVGHEFARTL